MRRALAEAGYDDIPKNGLYVIGGLAMDEKQIPLGQIIKELRMTKQAAGQLVDTLVLRGYLERSSDPTDRRKLSINLTVRGRAAAETQKAAGEKIDTELASRVGLKEIQSARRTLAALVDIGQESESETGGD